jgi:UPF0755 protein
MKRFLFVIILIAILIGGFIGYQKYGQVFHPNVPQSLDDDILMIPTGSVFEDVIKNLKAGDFILKEKSFRWVAEKMNYRDNTVKPGRYQIAGGMSNKALIGMLRSGNQAPVRITIRAAKHLNALAGMASEKLEFDSLEMVNYLLNEWIPNSDFSRENAISMFIPNTYEFFWNTSTGEFVTRMEKEYKKFWNDKRMEKAKSLDLSPQEIYTLASIVERETQNKEERSRIAGVYLNRIKKGMLLQADPTVIFAHQDFSMRRVLKKHLEIDSPYNTYKYAGLPPGPIYMPTIHAIDATLDAEDHEYIFFCVNPEKLGTHAFATTLRGHMRNARRYQQWANRNGIR